MNEQLIEDLKTLRYVLKDDNDYEKWVIILDEIIQSLKPNSEAMKQHQKEITDKDVWEWWGTQKFQKERGDQEYTMIYEIDLPKIIRAYLTNKENEK